MLLLSPIMMNVNMYVEIYIANGVNSAIICEFRSVPLKEDVIEDDLWIQSLSMDVMCDIYNNIVIADDAFHNVATTART